MFTIIPLRKKVKQTIRFLLFVTYGLVIYVLTIKILWWAEVGETLADDGTTVEALVEAPEVIDLKMVQVDEEYVETRPITVNQHELKDSDIKTLGEFLWKSPLVYKEQKVALLWVVFNRVDDKSGKFGSTIEEVVRAKHEFEFMTSHRFTVSDENKAIVIEELNRWLSLKEGCYIGEHISRKALYCSFYDVDNRLLKLYSQLGGDDYEIFF